MKTSDLERSDAVAHILVVDDLSAERGTIVRWLSAKGYHCAEASDAPGAKEQLEAQPADLVVLDLGASGRQGIELLREIKDRYVPAAVIVMAPVGQPKSGVDALLAGASSYLLKPVHREELLHHVANAMEYQQLLSRNRDYLRQLEERARQQTLAVRRAHEETIHRLVAASLYRDEETGMHIRRSGLISELLAKAAGWSVADAETIRLAAPMHDVGKIGIPDVILRKPGKLSRDEFEIMKTHTIIGGKMLAGSDIPMLKMAQEIALHHHERWDGAGYPAGRSSYDIPESARIVSIADVYDALTHDRIYRPGLSEEETLKLMQQGGGSHFDPFLLALFFSHLDDVHGLAEANPDELEDAMLLEQSLTMRC